MMNLLAVPVRFRILAVLIALSFINYLLRNNISVAIPSIREEFGFTSTEIGWILGSFNISYTILQIPGGVFGEAYGHRRALAWIAVTWGVLTFLTGFAPSLMAASATGAMISLIVVRFLMGIVNAPIFPITTGAIARWFPTGGWAFPNSLTSTGLTLGQAAIGPVATLLIIQFGWRASFYALAPLGFLVGAWWYWYGRDRPSEHRAITPAEVALINKDRDPAATEPPPPGSWREVLTRRDVLLLGASYFCSNVVFYIFSQWLFIYLVEERGFSLLESGFLYVLPFATGALMTAVGGFTCDRLCTRYGGGWGCRLPAMIASALVAVFLLLGLKAVDPYMAVILLSLCFGFQQFTEGPFASAATYLGGPHASTAYGVINTGANIAGFLAPVIGLMIDRAGWEATLAGGSVFALISAGLWLFIRIDGEIR
jgi:ACS family glucarate transporter-like MFS transporter